MFRTFLAVVLIGFCSLLHAEVYLCKLADGKSVAQDTPCPQGAKTQYENSEPPESQEVQAWRESRRRVLAEDYAHIVKRLHEEEKARLTEAEARYAAEMARRQSEENAIATVLDIESGIEDYRSVLTIAGGYWNPPRRYRPPTHFAPRHHPRVAPSLTLSNKPHAAQRGSFSRPGRHSAPGVMHGMRRGNDGAAWTRKLDKAEGRGSTVVLPGA